MVTSVVGCEVDESGPPSRSSKYGFKKQQFTNQWVTSWWVDTWFDLLSFEMYLLIVIHLDQLATAGFALCAPVSEACISVHVGMMSSVREYHKRILFIFLPGMCTGHKCVWTSAPLVGFLHARHGGGGRVVFLTESLPTHWPQHQVFSNLLISSVCCLIKVAARCVSCRCNHLPFKLLHWCEPKRRGVAF